MSDFEMRSGFCVIALRRIEADHDVGEGALGLNELEAVALAQLQLEADLFGRVAAQRAVSLQLPLDPQVFLGLQVDLDVEAVAHGARVVPQQPVHDDVGARCEVETGGLSVPLLWSYTGFRIG